MNPYLQLGGMAAGLVASGVQNSAQKRDRAIAGGAEDPAIAEQRRRLAATNAQTAMAVAAGQQGVNPALAQRNAQQALAQQQVKTNAMLAQQNAQSTRESRQADRRTQGQRVQGTIMGLAQGLNMLGTQGALDDASQAAMGPVASEGAKGKMMEAQGNVAPAAAPLSTPAMAPEGAAGLSAPPAPAAPVNGTIPVESQQMVAAMNENSTLPGGQTLGMPQMRGAETSSGVQMQPQAPAISPMQAAPVAERPVAPPAPQTTAAMDMAPAPPPMHWSDQWSMLPPEVQEDPVNIATLRSAEAIERTNPELAAQIMEQFYRGL